MPEIEVAPGISQYCKSMKGEWLCGNEAAPVPPQYANNTASWHPLLKLTVFTAGDRE